MDLSALQLSRELRANVLALRVREPEGETGERKVAAEVCGRITKEKEGLTVDKYAEAARAVALGDECFCDRAVYGMTGKTCDIHTEIAALARRCAEEARATERICEKCGIRIEPHRCGGQDESF